MHCQESLKTEHQWREERKSCLWLSLLLLGRGENARAHSCFSATAVFAFSVQCVCKPDSLPSNLQPSALGPLLASSPALAVAVHCSMVFSPTHWHRRLMPPLPARLALLFVCWAIMTQTSVGHPPTKRLHDDILSDYNRLIRPVNNHSMKLIVNLSLKLTQLIDMVCAFLSPFYCLSFLASAR